MRAHAGFTLTEILISSLLMSVVALGVYSMDVSRLRIQNDLRRITGATSDEMLAENAILHIEKGLGSASRVVMLNTDADPVPIWDGVMVRTTTGLDPTVLGNYRWDEYRLGAANDLLYFPGIVGGPCPVPVTLARQITGLTFAFRNEAPLNPPAGQVFLAGPEDNNVVSYTISWVNGAQTHTFVSEVTLRMAPYSNLGAANGDSGGGVGGVTPVPAAC